MSYSKPEQMSDQEFYISVEQVMMVMMVEVIVIVM